MHPQERTLGTVIRQLREQRGWSLQALAARAEMDKATVHNVEAGKTDTRGQTLSRIAVALGVTVEDLYRQQRATSGAVALQTDIGVGQVAPAPMPEDARPMDTFNLRRLETMLTLLPEAAASEIVKEAERQAVRRLADEELGGAAKKGATR